MFTLIHPDSRYLCSNFPQFFLHLKLFCASPCSQFIPTIYLFISSISLHLYVWNLYEAHYLHQWLCRIKIELHFLAGVAHPCLFPALYFFCSLHYLANLFVVIPSLFNCLSAFVFVLMFTESKDVFALSCLLLLFSEEVLLVHLQRPNQGEELCIPQHVHLLIFL